VPGAAAAAAAGPQADLKALLAEKGAEGIKLTFKPYDWTTNAAE
jgi:hypothetical protein